LARSSEYDILHHENSLLKGNWPEAINRLVVATDEAVKKIDLKSLLECNYSTTTKNSLTASRVVLLDMVKEYFSFKVNFLCGIPKVGCTDGCIVSSFLFFHFFLRL